MRYLLKDHLGSTDVLTDTSGAVVTRYAFDAWGKRRGRAFMHAVRAIVPNGSASSAAIPMRLA